jgi:hypothetical protein
VDGPSVLDDFEILNLSGLVKRQVEGNLELATLAVIQFERTPRQLSIDPSA